MKERTRDQGGPGTLTDDLVIPEVDASTLAGELLADLAARYGLRPSAARPGVFAYARQLWERRHFIVGFATARNVAMYTEARLGQLWQVLTPLLNAAVYYLIFGIILDTSRGVPNFLAFLITGIFIFNFTQRAFITTSRVMPDSLPLIRALPFPRACLPIGYVLIELEQLVMSMVVLAVIVLASGEPLTWYWLLALPALALQAVFNIGMGLSLARLGAGADDFSQLLPFLVRTWLYASGVMFSIQTIGSLGITRPSRTCCRSTPPPFTSAWYGTRYCSRSESAGLGASRTAPGIAPSTTPGKRRTSNTVPTATGWCR